MGGAPALQGARNEKVAPANLFFPGKALSVTPSLTSQLIPEVGTSRRYSGLFSTDSDVAGHENATTIQLL
jgi:hypothetical protein